MTALHWAAMNGDTELAQMLVFAGANVKATTRIGSYTPLYLASQQGNAAVLEVLLKAGADAKAGTANGTTPLMVAAQAGQRRRGEGADRAGADVNAKDGVREQTPLMYAAAANRAAVIELLAGEGRRPQGHQQGDRSVEPDARGRGLWRQSAGSRRCRSRTGRRRAARTAAGRRRRRGGAAPGAAAGHRSQLSVQRDDRRAGRPHAAAVRHAPGLRRIGRCAAQGRRRRQPDLGRRQDRARC